MDAPVSALLVEGVWLLLIGLAIVFAFLLVLVGVLMAMSWAVQRWGPEETGAVAAPLAPPPIGPAAKAEDATLTAVIAAAVQTYRRRSRP